MQTNEDLQCYQRLFQNLHSLKPQADQVLLSDPQKAQVLYQQLDKQAKDLLIVHDASLLLDVAKFRTRINWGIGHAAFLLSDYASAIQAFHTALTQVVTTPSEVHIGPLRGPVNTYMQSGQADRAKIYAMRAFDQANTLQSWNDAVWARFQIAQCDFNLGDRDLFLKGLQEANELAKECIAAEGTADTMRQELRKSKHEIEMHELQYKLTLDPTGALLHKVAEIELRKVKLSHDTVEDQIDKLCLGASLAIQQPGGSKFANDWYVIAEGWLERANELARANNLLAPQWSVLMSQARLYDAQGRLSEAVASAVEAVATTRALPAKTGKAPLESALQLLISLRYEFSDLQKVNEAEGELNELRCISSITTVASLEAQRAMIYYRQGQFELALQAMDELEKEDIELEPQRLSLSFSLQDLQKALMPIPTEGYSYQRDPYKAVLPQLSAWLLHPCARS